MMSSFGERMIFNQKHGSKVSDSFNNNMIATLDVKFETPDITLTMDETTFMGLDDGSTDIGQTLKTGKIVLNGEVSKLMTMLSTLTN